MVVAVMLLVGLVKGTWFSDFPLSRTDFLAFGSLVCLFLAGLALVRGKRYGVVCLAAGVLGWLIPVVPSFSRFRFTWFHAAMAVPWLVFGVIPLIVAVKNWRNFEP